MRKLKEMLWGRIYLWIFRPFYKLENMWLIWRMVNRNGVQTFVRYRKGLSGTEKRILSDLEKNGVALTSLEELFGNGAKRLETLRSYAGTPRTNRTKPYITEYFDEIPAISLDNPFTQLALDERVLNIAGSYLGMAPKFQEFTLAEISAVPEGTTKTGSMRWHRDPHDVRLCKMFIYLWDVGAEQGPFNYVTGSNYPNNYSRVFPQMPPSGIYPRQGEVEKHINQDDIRACTGVAGTIVFADTAGLHAGGFVRSGKRKMFTAGFLPPKSFMMRLLTYTKKTFDNLSPLQEYALCVSERLVSRDIFAFFKKTLLGAQSFGDHGTYM